MSESSWDLGEGTNKRRRMDWQPGLFVGAEAICIYHRTDGFCSPRNCENCKCWDLANTVSDATGLSYLAIAWILSHKSHIETLAKQDSK